jgi:tetratricopeptide (TPR) repeat protein
MRSFQYYEKAVVEFQSASGLDPHLVRSVNALSGSLFDLGRFSEAEAAARHALEIDPVNREAGYLVGRSLAAEDQNSMEAVELLRRSRPEIPMAQLILAGLLLKRNARDEAIAELRTYLQQPNAPLRDQASCMLEKLTLPPDKAVCSLN